MDDAAVGEALIAKVLVEEALEEAMLGNDKCVKETGWERDELVDEAPECGAVEDGVRDGMLLGAGAVDATFKNLCKLNCCWGRAALRSVSSIFGVFLSLGGPLDCEFIRIMRCGMLMWYMCML